MPSQTFSHLRRNRNCNSSILQPVVMADTVLAAEIRPAGLSLGKPRAAKRGRILFRILSYHVGRGCLTTQPQSLGTGGIEAQQPTTSIRDKGATSPALPARCILYLVSPPRLS